MTAGTYCFFGFSSPAIAGWLLPGLVLALGTMIFSYVSIMRTAHASDVALHHSLDAVGGGDQPPPPPSTTTSPPIGPASAAIASAAHSVHSPLVVRLDAFATATPTTPAAPPPTASATAS